MSGKLQFYYFGDDEAYFRALQGEFQRNARTPIEFKKFFETEEIKIQSLFLKIVNGKPACVFIDFSKHTQDYLHLARLISRTPMDHSMLMVGLLDYLSPPEVLKESIATGARMNFIKSAETFDVAFCVGKTVIPQSMGEHGFANASLKEEWETGTLCKIGYIHNQGIHIETDLPLKKGDRLLLDHYWQTKKIIPSGQMFVNNVTNNNMFYQFKLNADLEFVVIDEYIPAEGVTPEQIKEKTEERQELIRIHKKQLKRWLDDNQSSSQEKRAKILVVDQKFHFYQDQARTDKHPYTLRCIPFFRDIEEELNRLNPQIIAFELDHSDNPKNTLDELKKLMRVLSNRISDFSPFVVVFNTKMSSSEIQASIHYPQTLAYAEELSPDLLIKLADMVQKKMANTNTVAKKDEQRVFIKKNNLASVAEIIKSVTVIKLSETDMILQSDYDFPAGTNLHFSQPVEMFVNINPVAKPSGKKPEYYGLIHGLGESEKKELRRYVNSVFFRDHDAQVSAETEEFKKLNELKLQEKIAQEVRNREAEEASSEAQVPEKAKVPEVS